jgi:uncharacterized membrane protein YczE
MSIVLPIPADARPRRFVQLGIGLLLFGFSTGLLVEADLGLDPWDVLHQGAAGRVGLPIGVTTIAISALVLLLWIPLHQRPGFGTLANAVVVGLALDATLYLFPEPTSLPVRAVVLAAAIALNGVATGLYIGAGMGPGPRDGLMTGLAARGHSLRVVRTLIEVTVLVAGWLLGGTVGIGTIAYALAIGPLAHIFIPLFTVGPAVPARP